MKEMNKRVKKLTPLRDLRVEALESRQLLASVLCLPIHAGSRVVHELILISSTRRDTFTDFAGETQIADASGATVISCEDLGEALQVVKSLPALELAITLVKRQPSESQESLVVSFLDLPKPQPLASDKLAEISQSLFDAAGLKAVPHEQEEPFWKQLGGINTKKGRRMSFPGNIRGVGSPKRR